MQRTLIVIPIIHSQEDMGSLGRRLPFDPARHRRADERWAAIQRWVRALGLDWTAVRVYQDGLPDTDQAIVRKILAEVQSPNYDLLRWLVAQGAELVGTESPALMKEEYDHLQAVLTAKDAVAQARARRRYAERAGALLAARDAYLARRIAATLPPGGLGLLFIGQAHQLAPQLPPDIDIRKLPDDLSASSP
ncbi:MAG: hypothetical protein HY689_13725 [Chloroflexi bacterium]|nr:hypothetical protein [Chloroflexota bacterium]